MRPRINLQTGWVSVREHPQLFYISLGNGCESLISQWLERVIGSTSQWSIVQRHIEWSVMAGSIYYNLILWICNWSSNKHIWLLLINKSVRDQIHRNSFYCLNSLNTYEWSKFLKGGGGVYYFCKDYRAFVVDEWNEFGASLEWYWQRKT